MTDVAICKLTAQHDLTDAISLLQKFFREEGFDTPAEVLAAHVRQLAGLDACGLFVAIADGETIGVATVSLEFGIEFGWSAEMGDLYVVPKWRGRGVSKHLIEGVEAFLRSKQVAGYEVTVTPFSSEQHDLEAYYEKFGFVDEGRIILWKQL